MPRKRELSWHKQGRCWREYCGGIMYYMDPRGVNKTDDGAYALALANWQLKLAELEAEEKPSVVANLKLLDAAAFERSGRRPRDEGAKDRRIAQLEAKL